MITGDSFTQEIAFAFDNQEERTSLLYEVVK